MNATQFQHDYWPYFATRFPEVVAWLAKLDIDTMPTQEQVFALWRSTLDDVTIDEAKAATDAIYREQRKPDQWSAFPALIRGDAIASRPRKETAYRPPKMVDGEPTYRCGLCCDIGLVTVWHPASHKAAREMPDEFVANGARSYTCVVPCKCSGDRLRHLGPVYSPANMIRLASTPNRSDRERLVATLADRDAARPQRQRDIPLAGRSSGRAAAYDFGDYGDTIT